jgi:hypothetical protein
MSAPSNLVGPSLDNPFNKDKSWFEDARTQQIQKATLSPRDIVFFRTLPDLSDNLISNLYSADLKQARFISDHPCVILDPLLGGLGKVKICAVGVTKPPLMDSTTEHWSQVRSFGEVDSLDNHDIP